jgi:hypothetical protein
LHLAKICQALPSTEKLAMSKIYLAVATKPAIDDTLAMVCCHLIVACLLLTYISKASPPPLLMHFGDA